MIQANELRVGNWVLAPGGPIQIDRNDFAFTPGLGNIEDLNPIPLTPEVMERVNGLPNYYYWDNYVLWTYSNFYIAPCHYVHHLQNLIFALTGEEITYKP